VTCWAQLRIIARTIPHHALIHLPAIEPLIAQLTGWCAVTVAAAACVDRSGYADLGGAIAAPVSFGAIAIAWYAPRYRQIPNRTARHRTRRDHRLVRRRDGRTGHDLRGNARRVAPLGRSPGSHLPWRRRSAAGQPAGELGP
jgi:hypothetical protein